MDAASSTDSTNASDLELYACVVSVDGTGIPVAYLALSTQQAIEPSKRKRALTHWLSQVKEHTGLSPRVFHTDKDLAQSGAALAVWPHIHIQLCLWHAYSTRMSTCLSAL